MSGKSPEEIAFELVAKLKGMGVWGEKNMPDILDMYAECLDAAKGQRKYIPGRAILEPAAKAQLDAAHKQAAQRKAQQSTATPQAQPAQPVKAQQQMLQQAYKQA